MSETRYKEGDLVRIHNKPERFVGDPGTNTSMSPFFGKTVRIKCIADEDKRRYRIEEDNGRWTWAEQWLEPVDANESVNGVQTRFKVGDVVIGNDKSKYGITRTGWIGEVVRVNSRAEDEIGVRGKPESSVYSVSSMCFDLYKAAGQDIEANASSSEEASTESSDVVTGASASQLDHGGIITNEQDLKTILATFIARYHEHVEKGAGIIISPLTCAMSDSLPNAPKESVEITADDGLRKYVTFTVEQADISEKESLRLLAVTMYHLVTGKSEFSYECFRIDGYGWLPVKSTLWPVLLRMLNEDISDIAEVEALIVSDGG